MAEQFLTLMADLDEDTQSVMSAWYGRMKNAGFTGTQTPGLPYHISLSTFPPEWERRAVERMEIAAGNFPPLQVQISHIGIFAPGKVLFGGIERGAELERLHDACEMNPAQRPLWTPHVTVLIDEPAVVLSALPLFLESFHPLSARITRLHLCAFWPTREIASAELVGGKAGGSGEKEFQPGQNPAIE